MPAIADALAGSRSIQVMCADAIKMWQRFGIGLSFLLLIGCIDSSNTQKPKKGKQIQMEGQIDRESGYAPGTRWTDFLTCWYRAELAQIEKLRHRDASDAFQPFLNKLPRSPSEPAGEGVTKSDVDEMAARLGVILPHSYRDFLLAYSPVRHPAAYQSGVEDTPIGMYHPAMVGRLAVLHPEFLKDIDRFPINDGDDKYFVYGTKQDSVTRRVLNLRDAIVVGKHGYSYYELILLYPRYRTVDGEMEAALIYHAGEFRAPSFAELMRQLSMQKTRASDHVPPYAQKDLVASCAEKLPLSNIWWE